MEKKDKYDLCAERLLAFPGAEEATSYETSFQAEIADAWNCDYNDSKGCLFGYVWHERLDPLKTPEGRVGCLTQIRAGDRVACTPELTAAIRADERIPSSPEGITKEVIRSGVFQEWQRRIDREVRNLPSQPPKP